VFIRRSGKQIDHDAQPDQLDPRRSQRWISAEHRGQSAPYGMPPFYQELSDEQVASV